MSRVRKGTPLRLATGIVSRRYPNVDDVSNVTYKGATQSIYYHEHSQRKGRESSMITVMKLSLEITSSAVIIGLPRLGCEIE